MGLFAWLNRKLRVTATPEENDYLAWADTRLDELAGLDDRRKGDRRATKLVINHVHSFEQCDANVCRLPMWVRVPEREPGGRRQTDWLDG